MPWDYAIVQHPARLNRCRQQKRHYDGYSDCKSSLNHTLHLRIQVPNADPKWDAGRKLSSRTGFSRSGRGLCLTARKEGREVRSEFAPAVLSSRPLPGEPIAVVTAGVPARGGGGHAARRPGEGACFAIRRIIHTYGDAADRKPAGSLLPAAARVLKPCAASRDAAWTRSSPPIPGTGRPRRGCDRAATAECGRSSVRLQG